MIFQFYCKKILNILHKVDWLIPKQQFYNNVRVLFTCRKYSSDLSLTIPSLYWLNIISNPQVIWVIFLIIYNFVIWQLTILNYIQTMIFSIIFFIMMKSIVNIIIIIFNYIIIIIQFKNKNILLVPGCIKLLIKCYLYLTSVISFNSLLKKMLILNGSLNINLTY